MDYKELARDAKVMAESFRQDGNVYLPNRLEMYATAITDLLARAEAEEAEKQKLCEDADHLKDLLKETEAMAEKVEKCIAEIEEALKFGRYSAAMFQIFEYRGQKEE